MESLKYSCNESRRSCDSISILVVDDDTTCLSFVAALLKKLKYEVVTAKHPNDALCALRIKGDAFDLVVSDVHMPDMNGFELQQAITHEFNLPVVLMSVDSKEVVVSKGMKSGAAFFISKPVSPNDVKDLWKFVGMRKKSSHVVIEKTRPKRKLQGSDNNNAKKPKLIWTNALHYRFLEAIRTIGLERSVPKKILEAMNVPGLTRENVASHLQKYRMFLKRVSDASYKLEFSNDEGRRSVTNYSSSPTTPSLLTLNRLSKPHFPARLSSPYNISINGGLNNYERCISSGRSMEGFSNDGFDASSSQIVSNNYMHHTNYMGFKHVDMNMTTLNSNIVSLDQQPQYLGDSYNATNTCQQLSDHVYQDDHHLLPPSDPENGDQTAFGQIHDIMDSFKGSDDDIDSLQFNIQNLAHQNGCDYITSSFFDGMNNLSYDHVYHYQQVQGSIDEFSTTCNQFNDALQSFNHERGDDDFLQSLLAFGEDQLQTLEGI